MMTVKELIAKLEDLDDKEQEVIIAPKGIDTYVVDLAWVSGVIESKVGVLITATKP